MAELIDLSQDIYIGMPVHKVLPPVKVDVYATHEQWAGEESPETQSPSVLQLSMSEHTGTHVDALSHMTQANKGQSIDTMPLENFYTRGICLDFTHKSLRSLITPEELEKACNVAGVEVCSGDTVLICTNHYQKAFGTEDWPHGPGLNAEAAKWLGNKGIAAFGVETMAPGVSGVSNKDVHRICGEMGFTHYENLIRLNQLVGRGVFRFIAFPLKIIGGTGSPVRAVAVFEN